MAAGIPAKEPEQCCSLLFFCGFAHIPDRNFPAEYIEPTPEQINPFLLPSPTWQKGRKSIIQEPNFIQKRKQAALLVGGLPAFVELFYGNDKKEVYAKSLD